MDFMTVHYTESHPVSSYRGVEVEGVTFFTGNPVADFKAAANHSQNYICSSTVDFFVHDWNRRAKRKIIWADGYWEWESSWVQPTLI